MLALILVAMMSAVLFGSLSMAARTWDRGEGKASRTTEMRLTEEFLRRTLGNAYPPRDLNNLDAPASFQGAEDWIAFPALLPDRLGGELLYFKLGLAGGGPNSRLVLARANPPSSANEPLSFDDDEVKVLAEGISSLRIRYFGNDVLAGPEITEPTWRPQWSEKQQWPMLVQLDFTPREGPAWPPLIVELKFASRTMCDEIARAHNMCNQN